MDLAGLASAVDELDAGDAAASACGDDLVELAALRARLDAVAARAAAAFEAGEAYVADGARTAAAWMATRTRRPIREARAELRIGRALRELPHVEEAFRAGQIGASHVRLFATLLRRACVRAALADGEALLVEQAKRLQFSAFEQAVAYFAQLADPDGAEERAEAMRARRDVYLHQSFEGEWFGGITLDPIAGAIVEKELGRLEQVAFEADWRAAEERLGGAPTKEDLARTAAQRRADALVEMAKRSAACPDVAPFAGPLVSVLVDFPTMAGRICELANGTVVSPGSLLPYLDEAMVERAVFRGRARIEVGARSRFFTGATRRAIELRDRICQHPFCEAPVDRCEVDHIVPASEGGLTTLENGRLLCKFHNRLRNRVRDLPTLPDPPWTVDQPEDPPRRLTG